jgi:hypothetical protein
MQLVINRDDYSEVDVVVTSILFTCLGVDYCSNLLQLFIARVKKRA